MPKTDRTWDLLQAIDKKLDAHSEDLATLKAEARFAKEAVGDAEKLAKSAKAEVGKLKLTLARWGGAVAASLVGLELFLKFALGH